MQSKGKGDDLNERLGSLRIKSKDHWLLPSCSHFQGTIVKVSKVRKH